MYPFKLLPSTSHMLAMAAYFATVCSIACLLDVRPLPAQTFVSELRNLPASQEAQQLSRLLDKTATTRELLAFIEELHQTGRLGRLGNGNLPFTTLDISGWRWETTDESGERVILAADGPILVAIRLSRTLSMSIQDLSSGSALKRGYAQTSRYFGHTRLAAQHLTAHSPSHLSRRDPEMFQWFYYFAGPLTDIFAAVTLP
jgi:hypothetical protein